MKYVLILLVILITSCTVTKRLHRPGFQIEWKQKLKSKSAESFAPLTISDATILYETVDRLEKVDPSDNEPLNASTDQIVADEYTVIATPTFSKERIDIPKTLAENSLPLRPIRSKTEKSKIEPLAIVAVISVVLIPIVCAFALIGSGTGFLWVIAAILLILAIVFGILARRKIKKSKTSQQNASASQSAATRKTEPFSLTSTLLVSLALLFALIAIFGSGTGIFLFFALVVSILAMLFGLIGLIRFKKRPGLYKGKTLALIGFNAGIVLAFLLLIIPGLISGGKAFLNAFWTFNTGGF